ncbi:amino acid ABC transporter substrate-binding protein [Colwellia demingiae]|uniref:Amino acid ABC transporter substrate-binding protein n=1 Tax=Colwellia demingiae TaxID=89401 RepID=A0A5C6QF88_9GAMM|nr:transporter substrate-binding domain-containing protein [Colwellia demingiae]TWX67373.1 amino acid ABC transporter substrate-binding protein [Colwellia demingiae]
MIKFLTSLILLLLTSSTFACTESESKLFLSKLHWVTEDYPPYNYLDESGRLVGAVPEILAMIYNELSIKKRGNNIIVLPWARLIMYMERYSDYAAFSMVTTPERASKFQLVPLPTTTKISILALTSNIDTLQNKTFDELTIAVVRGDIGQKLLNIQKNPAKQVETISAVSMLEMLLRKRVDAIAYSEDVTYYQLKKLGVEKNTVTSLYLLKDDSDVNFVFHKGTSNCVIDLFTKELATLNRDGKLQPVWKKYIQD